MLWSDILKQLRAYLDLSQREMADRLEVSEIAYQRWEQGKAKPRPYYRRKIRDLVAQELPLLGPDQVSAVDALKAMQEISYPTEVSTAADVEEIQEISSPHHNAGKHTDPPEEQAIPVHSPVVATFPSSLVASDTPIASPNGAGETVIIVSAEIPHKIEMFPETDILDALWTPAFLPDLTCNEKRSMTRQVLQEFDAMNTTNKNYQITRRDAIRRLARLPIITLGLTIPGNTVRPAQYGDTVRYCAAALEGCWELSKSSERSDLELSFGCASKYIPILDSIAQYSSGNRQEATVLAGEYALLKATLAWHLDGLAEAALSAKQAIHYGGEAGNALIQAHAYQKLIYTYLFDNKRHLATIAILQAEQFLKQHRSSLPPHVLSNYYSAQALVEARNGEAKQAMVTLEKASTAFDPGEPSSISGDNFTESKFISRSGRVHLDVGDQTKAQALWTQIIDPETLTLRVPESERMRLAGLSELTLSALNDKERDMEKTIHFWTAAMQGAKALQSELRYKEGLILYDMMQAVWPGEQRIQSLRPLTVHWNTPHSSLDE